MFSQVEVEVIADAGHWVHADQPAAFVACVKQALALLGHPIQHATAAPTH